MSTRLGAAPRTPTLGRSKIRRFGTVLSVNSPGVTPSIQKKPRGLRNNAAITKPSIPEEETTILFPQQKEKQQFTVTFDAGPIGLQIDPATCQVQCILGDDSPARTLGMILEGDVVVAVNDMPMVPDAESAEELWSILQNVKTRRSITFERVVVVGDRVVPVEGPENQSSSADVLSPLPPPRSITFLKEKQPLIESIFQPSVTQSLDATTANRTIPDELALTRHELLGATDLLQQMQAKIDALEAENAALKNAPPKQQPYPAIRDMEFKMRIHSLENQLQQSDASRSKLKEQVLAMDRRLQEQSEHHNVTLDQTSQELQDALSNSKQLTQLLEKTRKELTTTKKEYQDEVNGLHRERDQLLECVDQHASELERSRAAKVQSDVRLQQLEENRIVLEEELQRTRTKVEESDMHAQQNSEQLLHTIRSKDVQIEALRMELVALQTVNATLQTDLSEKDAVVRQVMADTEQRSKDHQALQQDLVNMTSLLEMSHQDKERLVGRVTKLEGKLLERNQAMDSMKVTLQKVQDDFATQMMEQSEAMAASAESIDTLYREKEVLTRQLLEAQVATETNFRTIQELRDSLATTQLELSNLRNAASSEKCDLLKQLEELEGAVKVSRATILRQEAVLLDSDSQLRAAQEHGERVAGELKEHQQRLLERENTIQEKEQEIVQLKEAFASKEVAFTTSIQSLNDQLDQSKQVNDALTKENCSMTFRLDAMYKSLMSACLVELALKAALKGSQSKISSLKIEQKRLLLNFDELQRHVSSRDATIESLHVNLTRTQCSLERLQIDNRRLTLDLAKRESAYEESLIEIVRREAKYQSFLASLFSEKERMRNHLTAQAEQVNDLYKSVEALTSETTGLRNHMLEVQTAAISKDASIAELQAKLVDVTFENEKLLSSAIHEKDDLTLQLETCMEAIVSLQSSFALSEKNLLDKSFELASTIAKVEKLETELLSSGCSLREAKNQVDERNILIESLNQSIQTQLQGFQRELLEKDELILDLRGQIKKQESSVVQSLEHAKTTELELLNARSELLRKLEQLDSLNAALEVMQCQLKETVDSQRDSDLTIESLNESLKRSQQQLVSKTEEFIDLTKLYETLKFESDILNQQFMKSQTEYNTLSVDLQASFEATIASNNRTEELKSEILLLQEKFETEIANTVDVFSALTVEKDAHLKELLETKDHLHNSQLSENRLRSEVEKLKFQLSNSEADFQKCSELLESQTRECDVAKQNSSDLKLRCDKLLHELKQSESSLDSFSRLVDNQNAQIAICKQSIVAQQADFDRQLRQTKMESQDLLFANKTLNETNLNLSKKISIIETTTTKDRDIISTLKRRIGELESEHSITINRANRNEQDLFQRVDDLSQEIKNTQSILEDRENVIVDLKERQSVLSSEHRLISDQLAESFVENRRLKRSTLHFEMMFEVAKRNEAMVIRNLDKDWTLKMDSLKRQYDTLLSSAESNAAVTNAEFHLLKTNFAKQIDEVKSLHELLGGMKSENDTLSADIVIIKSELHQREDDLSEAILRIETANKLIVEKDNNLDDAERSLERARIKAQEQEERYANLARESSEGRNDMVAEIILLRGQIDALKLELSESGSVIKSLTMNLSESELIVKRLKDELSMGKEALDELSARSAASKWALECEVEASKTEINNHRDASIQLTSDCNALRTALSALQSKFNDVSEMHLAAVAKFDSTESSMLKRQDELLAQVEFANDTISKVSEELRVLKFEHDSYVAAAESDKRQLEEKIRLHQSEASLRLERQVEWNRKLDEARSSYHRCRSDLDIASDKITQLEGFVNNRNEEIQKLSVLLEKTIEENIASIDSTSQSHSLEISRFQQEIEEYNSKLQSSSATIDLLTLRTQKLEDELSGLQSERSDLVSEKNSLLLLLEEHHKVLADLQSDLNTREHLSSETDIVESPFKSLSKKEIKDKCLDVQFQLQATQKSLSLTNEDLCRRSEHVKQLVHDLDTMSVETGRLVAANEMLELRLNQVTSINGTLESGSLVANNKITFLEDQLQNKTKKLEQLSAINEKVIDEIQSLKFQSKSERLMLETEKNNAINDLAVARQELENVIAKRDEVELLFSENRVELNLLRDVEVESKAKIHLLELDIADLKERLTASNEETLMLGSDLKKKIELYSQQVSSLESECEALRSRATVLQLDGEEKDVDLRDKEEKVRLLSEELLNQRQLTLSADQFREDVVSKLSEATRVITSQRFMIKKLESRALDAERNCAHLSDRIDDILSRSEKNQANAVEHETQNAQLTLDLEQKLKEMDDTRANAVQSVQIIQDELQKVQFERSESEKSKVTLQKRVDELKNSIETLKTQLSESRIARDESGRANHQLQAELDSKRMEIDHLKATLQVTAATAARLKATAFLQESESQTEKSSPDLPSNQASSSKPSSPTPGAESLQQALRLYEMQEETLMRFVNELMTESERVFGVVGVQSDHLFQVLERSNTSEDMKALDLAGMESSSNFLESFRSNMNRLSMLIASYFENRQSHVQLWRDCYNNQKGMILAALSPAENDAVDKIDLFKDDLTQSIRTYQSEHPDLEFFKSVIVSLEENIDALLADLKAANEALHEKDFLLAKLESLVAYYELTDSKDTSNESLKDCQTSQQPDSAPAMQHKDPSACKLAAGRLLLQALDGRAHAAKAVAFRQWACQTSAMSALAKHGSTAAALAQQLEETREKLVVLKRHLKKSRRGGTRDYSTNLDRIEEHESEI